MVDIDNYVIHFLQRTNLIISVRVHTVFPKIISGDSNWYQTQKIKKHVLNQGPLITDGRNCNEMWILSMGLL